MSLVLPSTTEARVLDLLTQHGALYGLQLVALSNGLLKRGTVYVTLSRMQDKGYVRSLKDDQPEGHAGMPRPRYQITAKGQRSHHAYLLAQAALSPQRSRA